MSILADVRNSVDDVESVGPSSQSRQTRRDSLNNGRATVDRPASAEKSKPRSFHSAALGETIRLAQLGDPSTAGRFDRQTAPRALYRAVTGWLPHHIRLARYPRVPTRGNSRDRGTLRGGFEVTAAQSSHAAPRVAPRSAARKSQK